MARNALTRQPF